MIDAPGTELSVSDKMNMTEYMSAMHKFSAQISNAIQQASPPASERPQ